MTKFSFRSAPGLSAVRNNPDLWAIAVLVLVLAITKLPAVAPALDARTNGFLPRVAALDAAAVAPVPMSERMFRLTRIANRIESVSSPLDMSLEEWAARMERKKERLWKRLEDKMRRLEERIEKHEMKLKSRAIATREE